MQQYRFSAAELKKITKNIVILIDSREKKNGHILDYLNRQKIPYEIEKLDYGDYSFYLSTPSGERVYFHRDIVIERKASLEELSGNLAQEREAFEKEFLRAGNDGAKIYLMVEDKGGYSSIIGHKYQTQFSPAAYMASLKTWEHRFEANIQFIDPQYSGFYIYSTFTYFVREALK